MREYKLGEEPVPGYQIIRPLGAGGYGTVWVAKSPGDVEIALKIINLQGQGLKEFRAISLVKRLRHPNLIPIYAFWLKDEFGNFLDSTAQDSVNLRGRQSELIIAYGLGDKSLAQRLDECKQAFAQRHGLPDTDAPLIAKLQELQGTDLAGLPVEELLDYMFGAAKAIDYLNQPTHNLGTGPPAAIQHCDIKPGNLLIVSNDVQVCDYGLARVADDARKTQAAGTPAYMAPELFANKPSNGTDQYSLAITFYELRTGRLPFEESVAFHAHIMGQLDFGLVTPTEQEILRRATHMRPDQRYPHSIEMVRALREAITPTRSPTPLSSPIIGSSAQHQPLPVSSDSKIQRGEGSGPPVPASSSSTPTVFTKVTVLDDLIRAGVELVPGHRLDALLGRGGYGEVWSATMPGKTKCALKIVRNLDAVQGRQELKSLDMIRDLDHDRLIRLQSYWLLAHDGSVIPDEEIGQPGAPKASGLVVATDLAQQNLLQRWQECYDQGQSGIPVAELVPYVRQSAEAIDHLNFHEPAIIHRDIKPENILLTKNKQVKVSDFGLAKLVEGTNAAIGSASVGMTLAYAAPEMFRNTVTKWTDQYSLAITYYRLRTGRLPFEDGMGPIQMMQAHTSGMLDFTGVGPAEQAVLKRSCALEPEARFGSCLEFADALGIAAGISRPVVSTPSMPQTHPVSSPFVGVGAGGRRGGPVMEPTSKFPNLPGMSDSSSNIRETIRFEDLKSSTPPPAGWPPQPPDRPAQKESSGEFHLPDNRRSFPGGPPVGLMETTTQLPSAADVDTDPDGTPRPRWQEGGAGGRSTGGGSKLAIAAAVVLIAGIGVGGYLVWSKNRTTDSRAVAINDGKTKLVPPPTHPETKESTEATTKKTGTEKTPDPDKDPGKSEIKPPPPPPPPTYDDETIKSAFAAATEALRAGHWKDAQEKLASLKGMRASPGNDLPRRAEALRRYVAKLATVEPTEAGVIQLAEDIQRYPGALDEKDVAPLNDASCRQLGKSIANAVPTLSDKSDWNKLLNACRIALPAATEPTASYVLGCEAESAAELQATQMTPPDSVLADINTALASRTGSDPTGSYLTYAKARLAWEKAKTDTAAAGQMLAVYTGPDKSASALVATHRKSGAAHVLEGAARLLRQNPTNPLRAFKEDGDARRVVEWLKVARTLSNRELALDDKLTLTLAADQTGDKQTAREGSEAFATPDVLSKLPVADALAVTRVRAGVQDLATEAGQLAQTGSYSAIIGLSRDRPKEVPADLVYRIVVQPILKDQTGKPTATKAKVGRAELLAAVAKRIQNDPRTWARLFGKEFELWTAIKSLYSSAERLDPRPEYTIQKAFAAIQGTRKGVGLPMKDLTAMANAAIAKDGKYAGGHALLGTLLYVQATNSTDRPSQVKYLTDAVEEFKLADSLSGANAPPEDLRWLYQSWSGACLLLGNFTADLKIKDEMIRDAFTYAEKLTEKDPRYFEGWLALGNAAEDIAYFLGDSEYFLKATRAFEEAKKLVVLPGEVRPILGTGRCAYRRAEKIPASSSERRREARQFLTDAETDLGSVVAQLAESATPDAKVFTAEAHYWLGKSHALRADFARASNDGQQAQEETTVASREYGRAAEIAAHNEVAGRDWARWIGVDWCGLEMKQAQSLMKRDPSKALDYLKRTRELAGDLRKYSAVAAAQWEAAALEQIAALNKFAPETVNEVVQVLEAGLVGGTAADKVDQYDIGRRLSGWYSGGRLPGGKNWDKAFRAMDAAAQAARDAGLDIEKQAQTLADAAFCRQESLKSVTDEAKQRQYRDEFVERYRHAAEIAPEHQYAWYWKALAAAEGGAPRVAALRKSRPDDPGRVIQEARYLEEASRLYREVDEANPPQLRTVFPKFDDERKALDGVSKSVLAQAIAQAPNDRDAWKWQWTLAEILARPDGGDIAEAKQRIAAAQRALPNGVPDTQRDRIEQLRKSLDQRN